MTESTDDIPGSGESLAGIIPAAAPPPRRRRGRPPGSGTARHQPAGGDSTEASTSRSTAEQTTLRLIEEAVPVPQLQPQPDPEPQPEVQSAPPAQPQPQFTPQPQPSQTQPQPYAQPQPSSHGDRRPQYSQPQHHTPPPVREPLPAVNLTELKRRPAAELLRYAEELGIDSASTLKKSDMVFSILKRLAETDVPITGEGVLEILQDGFGFLRSPDVNYVAGPDDVYVSPSQIRRFALRTGDVVQGQVRAPKEGERYFALLRANTN